MNRIRQKGIVCQRGIGPICCGRLRVGQNEKEAMTTARGPIAGGVRRERRWRRKTGFRPAGRRSSEFCSSLARTPALLQSEQTPPPIFRSISSDAAVSETASEVSLLSLHSDEGVYEIKREARRIIDPPGPFSRILPMNCAQKRARRAEKFLRLPNISQLPEPKKRLEVGYLADSVKVSSANTKTDY